MYVCPHFFFANIVSRSFVPCNLKSSLKVLPTHAGRLKRFFESKLPWTRWQFVVLPRDAIGGSKQLSHDLLSSSKMLSFKIKHTHTHNESIPRCYTNMWNNQLLWIHSSTVIRHFTICCTPPELRNQEKWKWERRDRVERISETFWCCMSTYTSEMQVFGSRAQK